jgi:predicted  nucleic acid-binding Zn-ribbon protein
MFYNREGLENELEQVRDNLTDAEAHIEKLEARIEKLEALLNELEEWFDDRSDADCEDGRYQPNPEMQMLMQIREVL